MAEILYNNIVLSEEWPPRYTTDILKGGQPIPYLTNPPAVIDITVGRQLFVDDFLIESTDCVRSCHSAEKYEKNPVFFPETPMEKDEALPFAAPKDGGVWYDRDEKIYKMWYEAGWLHKHAYAVSRDGIRWERPNLHVVEGTNEILPEREWPEGSPGWYRPDSSSVVIDYDTDCPEERYKIFVRNPGGPMCGLVGVSGDGIHFTDFRQAGKQGDRSTVFYNPFRKKWVHSIRTADGDNIRQRAYYECDDYLSEANWEGKSVPWLCADAGMKSHPYTRLRPQLYNFNAIAYESIMLGMFQVFYGPSNEECFESGAPKITELIPVYSRDGFHFYKPSNQPIIRASLVEGAWDRGYVQSVGGGCLVYPDTLRLYYSGVAGNEKMGGACDPNNPADFSRYHMYAGGATGFATLRRDGFVSLGTEDEGVVDTRKLTFRGEKRYFFINAKAENGGSVSVDILSADGKTVLASSGAFVGDDTCAAMDFGNFDLSALADKEFRLRFRLRCAEIYAFWFSDSENGESGGYDGAGSPER